MKIQLRNMSWWLLFVGVILNCGQSSVRKTDNTQLAVSGKWILVNDANGKIDSAGEITVPADGEIVQIYFDEAAYTKLFGSFEFRDCGFSSGAQQRLYRATQDGIDYIGCVNSNQFQPFNRLYVAQHERSESYKFCIGDSMRSDPFITGFRPQCYWVVKDDTALAAIAAEYRAKFQDKRKDFANQRKSIERKTGKIPTGGKFGGGYKEAKWGQTPEETAQIFSPLTVDVKDATVYIHESEKLKVFFTYYLGVLAEVEVRLKLDGYDFTDSRDAREALIKKYGKPAIKQTRKGVDTLDGVPYAFTVKSLTWHDGVTSIETTQCELIRGDSNGCLKEAEGLSIIYKSSKLAPLLTKLRKENDHAANKYKSAF